MNKSLDYIYKEQKNLSTLGGVASLLGWDQMTYMPPKGINERSKQASFISGLIHERIVSDKLWEHVKKLSKEDIFKNLSKKDQNVVRRLYKDIKKARKVPSDFVKRMSETTTMAYQAWEKSRGKKDFKIFSPHLEKIIDLEKEYIGYMDIPGPRYNSLIDDYEEGMTVDKLKKEFSFLKPRLTDLLEKIKDSDVFRNQKPFDLKVNGDIQKKLCQIVIKKMRLKKDSSRLDVSTHPFTISMGYDDVRITTSFERKNPLFSFFSTVHEAGHALYEQGMPRDEYKDTVISDSPSLGLHESQSRFWENMIARSKNFWRYFFPVFKKEIPGFKDKDFTSWYKNVNQVRPSLIRVEADELTYCLHVILRFELELDLIDDKIRVDDLPEIWNNKMDEMLGVIPENDVEGVLQDMHWSGGSFGYFPTYAIGTIYASQLFNRLTEEKKNVDSLIEKGNFEDILSWLRKNFHSYGRRYTADEIIKKTCGEGLNSQVFVDYLKDKYSEIYEI